MQSLLKRHTSAIRPNSIGLAMRRPSTDWGVFFDESLDWIFFFHRNRRAAQREAVRDADWNRCCTPNDALSGTYKAHDGAPKRPN
jgi:hypothetical protein